MEREQARIGCSRFRKHEPLIKNITEKINRAGAVQAKAKFACDLQDQVEELLGCPDYDSKKLDCKNCHFIANLRKKTANLVIKAKKLA